MLAPKSLVKQWQSEAQKWCSRAKDWLSVHSYEAAKQDLLADTLVLDEVHYLRNAQSVRYEKINKIARERRIGLTATPLQNNLMEFFNLLHVVLPRLLENDKIRAAVSLLEEARRPTATPAIQQAARIKLNYLQDLVQPHILRRDSDVNRQWLPPRSQALVFCLLSPNQIAAYRDILRTDAGKGSLALVRKLEDVVSARDGRKFHGSIPYILLIKFL